MVVALGKPQEFLGHRDMAPLSTIEYRVEWSFAKDTVTLSTMNPKTQLSPELKKTQSWTALCMLNTACTFLIKHIAFNLSIFDEKVRVEMIAHDGTAE